MALAAHEQARLRLAAAGEEASGRVADQLEEVVAKHDAIVIRLEEAALVERSTEVTLAVADRELHQGEVRTARCGAPQHGNRVAEGDHRR